MFVISNIFIYLKCIFVCALHIHKYTFCTFLFVNVCFGTATICYHHRLFGVFRAAFFRLYCENIRAHIKQIFAVVIIWFWSVRRTAAEAEGGEAQFSVGDWISPSIHFIIAFSSVTFNLPSLGAPFFSTSMTTNPFRTYFREHHLCQSHAFKPRLSSDFLISKNYSRFSFRFSYSDCEI